MIKIETRKIRLSQIEAEKRPAFSKKESVYANEELSFTVNAMSGKNFRLVHDKESVFILFEGTDRNVTTTIHKAEEFKTEKMALDKIKDLGLKYVPLEYTGLDK